MLAPEPFLIFTRRLNATGLRYMVTGSVAAMFYGEPRLTNDVDIVLFLKRDDLPAIAKAFPDDEFYCPPLDVIKAEHAREQRGHFNLIHHDTGFKADIYLTGRDALHLWALPKAQAVSVDDDVVWLAPAAYVIVRKLQFYGEGKSEKHLRDIGRMIVSERSLAEDSELVGLIHEHALQAEWQLACEQAE